MYASPLLLLICSVSLFGAAATVAKDMQRRDGIVAVGLKPDLQKT
jgi:hypothetical protein